MGSPVKPSSMVMSTGEADTERRRSVKNEKRVALSSREEEKPAVNLDMT
jgi:hypothetical protein